MSSTLLNPISGDDDETEVGGDEAAIYLHSMSSHLAADGARASFPTSPAGDRACQACQAFPNNAAKLLEIR